MSDASNLRLPDFLIIGTMKSGTTTLFRWLEQQPEFVLPRVKEPHFFSDERRWRRGIEWYAEHFADAPKENLTGEASPGYTSPISCAMAANRIADELPDVRLICILRHPIERLRSQFRHQVQRGRESRTLLQAVSEVGNEYVGRSLYYACLKPYIELFDSRRLCVVRFEDLVTEDAPGWKTILEFLGVDARPVPRTVHNTTATKPQFTPVLLWLWEKGLMDHARHLPRPLRRLGAASLTRGGASFERQLRQSSAVIPSEVTQAIWQDVKRLEDGLGLRTPFWVESSTADGPESAMPSRPRRDDVRP